MPTVELSRSTESGIFVIGGEADGALAGWSVSGGGDINGDGLDDFLVGAPGDDEGKVYVIFGTTGMPTFDAANSGAAGFVVEGDLAGDGAGWSASFAGDLDGDGYDELVIGAPRGDDGGPDAGEAYVLFGHGGSFANVDLSAAGTSILTIRGAAAGDKAGFDVSSIGDINGDGYDDLVIGAPYGDNGGTDAGEAYVIFGKASGLVGTTIDLASLGTAGFAIQGDAAGDWTGWAVSSAGDVNGDGFDDLVIGAPDDAGVTNHPGAAYVVSGHGGSFADIDLSNLGAAGFAIHSPRPEHRAGFSVSSAGDLNGDGFDELIVGSSQLSTSHVIYGHGGSFSDLEFIGSGSSGFLLSSSGSDHAGYSASAAGDINGDGFDDLIVGAPLGDPSSNAIDAGRAYVLFGHAGSFGTPDNTGRIRVYVNLIETYHGPAGLIIEGAAAGDHAGWSVSAAGDVNGDGYDDLIVGAPGSGADAGQAYVIYGAPSAAATLTGTAGDDILHGSDSYDTISGGDGNDFLVGEAGGDQLQGDAGDDTISGRGGTDSISGGDGNDRLWAGGSDDLVSGGLGNDVATGGEGDDRLDGDGGDDTLSGDLGKDELRGGDGQDTLDGGDDNDWLYGDAGADVLSGGNHDDNLSGGADDDLLTGGDGNDSLFGGAGADTLDGGSGDDTLDGGGSGIWHDTLRGGLGNDRYIVNDDASLLTLVELAGEGSDTVESRLASYTLGDNFENLAGGLDNGQQLTGNAVNNVIEGRAGADQIAGFQGDDVLRGWGGNDLIQGGDGLDTLEGGDGNDRLSGKQGNDTLLGGAGRDQLSGGIDDDLLEGGADGDALYGDDGNDKLKGEDGADTLNGGNGTDGLDGGLANDVLHGDDGDDRLYGGDGNDVLDGGGGIDQLRGGYGNDVYLIDETADKVVEGVSQGIDEVRTTRASYTLGANVENLTGLLATGQKLTGNIADNLIVGGAGNDRLIGLDGNDVLKGNAGNDVLLGGAGRDALNGGTGADSMTGGTGDDTYYVDNGGDTVIELGGTDDGIDTIVSNIDLVLFDYVEQLRLNGAAVIGTGNDLSNVITGTGSKNVLSGEAGYDTLYGQGGNDTLDGGNGNDVLDGGTGKDTLTGGSGLDQFAFEEGGSGATWGTADVITDFRQAQDDRIKLRGIDANTIFTGDQKFHFLGAGAFTGEAGELHYVQNSGYTFVEGDTNGDGTADFVIRLVGTINLTAGDFVL